MTKHLGHITVIYIHRYSLPLVAPRFGLLKIMMRDKWRRKTLALRVKLDGSRANGMRKCVRVFKKLDHNTNLDNSRPIALREEIACIGPLPDER